MLENKLYRYTKVILIYFYIYTTSNIICFFEKEQYWGRISSTHGLRTLSFLEASTSSIEAFLLKYFLPEISSENYLIISYTRNFGKL